MKNKTYYNLQTEERTDKSVIALAWHREGKDVFVEMPSKNKVILINGATVETSQQKQDRENREHCKRIADDLSDYANKLVYRCPECNEIITVPSNWTGDEYFCPDCGNRHSENEMEMLSMYNYFEDVLDIEYRINSDKQLRSVQIMVACGGPNIYIDTASKQVELYWWGDRASYPINYDVCDEIYDYFEELYQC